jgi:hypothetical protein
VKASSARLVLVPMRPSISPGEKPARSSMTCVCSACSSSTGAGFFATVCFAAGFFAGVRFCGAASSVPAKSKLAQHTLTKDKTQEERRTGDVF